MLSFPLEVIDLILLPLPSEQKRAFLSSCSLFRALYGRYAYPEKISVQHLHLCPHPEKHPNLLIEGCYTNFEYIRSYEDTPFILHSLNLQSLDIRIVPQREQHADQPFPKSVKELSIATQCERGLGRIPQSVEKLTWKQRLILDGMDFSQHVNLKHVDFHCMVSEYVLGHLPPQLETLVLHKNSFSFLRSLAAADAVAVTVSFTPGNLIQHRLYRAHVPKSLKSLSIADAWDNRLLSTDSLDSEKILTITPVS